jgi:hypothetical protein
MAKKRRLRKTAGMNQPAPQVEEAAAPAPYERRTKTKKEKKLIR